MTGWTAQVEAPFRDDASFWRAVGLSVTAFVSLVAVAIACAVVRSPQLWLAFVVPLGLLAASAAYGRAATERTRPDFSDRSEWRDAERRAVAAALRGLVMRS